MVSIHCFFQDIDIKKVNGVPQYAFLQYCDIASVCKAIKKMDGEYLGNNRLKVKEFICYCAVNICCVFFPQDLEVFYFGIYDYLKL